MQAVNFLRDTEVTPDSRQEKQPMWRTSTRFVLLLAFAFLGSAFGLTIFTDAFDTRANADNPDDIRGYCAIGGTPCARCSDTQGIYYCFYPPTSGFPGLCQAQQYKFKCNEFEQDCGIVTDCVTGRPQGACGTEEYCYTYWPTNP